MSAPSIEIVLTYSEARNLDASLEIQEAVWRGWLNGRHATDHERELALSRLDVIEVARRQIQAKLVDRAVGLA